MSYKRFPQVRDEAMHCVTQKYPQCTKRNPLASYVTEQNIRFQGTGAHGSPRETQHTIGRMGAAGPLWPRGPATAAATHAAREAALRRPYTAAALTFDTVSTLQASTDVAKDLEGSNWANRRDHKWKWAGGRYRSGCLRASSGR